MKTLNLTVSELKTLEHLIHMSALEWLLLSEKEENTPRENDANYAIYKEQTALREKLAAHLESRTCYAISFMNSAGMVERLQSFKTEEEAKEVLKNCSHVCYVEKLQR